MSSSSVNICVIGAGKIFQNYHLSSILKQPDVRIKYIVDKNEQLANKIANQLGAISLTNPEKIEDCDICFVATPPSTRVDIFNVIKNKKIDLVFEKPMAFNLESAKLIVDEAYKLDNKVYVTQTRRFFPNLCLVRKLLRSNMFSNLVEINIFEGGIFNWVTESNYLKRKNTDDMGVVHDIGAHVFDYLLQLLNDIGFCQKDIVITKSIVDYDCLANNLISSFSVGKEQIKVNVNLSRNILLMNKIIIKFDNGLVLTTDSGYSNKISLIKDQMMLNIDVHDKDIEAVTFESVFDNLWKSIINEKKCDTKKNELFDINASNVLPSIQLIDRIIESREVKSFEIFFNTYGYENTGIQ